LILPITRKAGSETQTKEEIFSFGSPAKNWASKRGVGFKLPEDHHCKRIFLKKSS